MFAELDQNDAISVFVRKKCRGTCWQFGFCAFCFRTIRHDVAEDSPCFGMIDDDAYIVIRACGGPLRNLIGQYDVRASYSSS